MSVEPEDRSYLAGLELGRTGSSLVGLGQRLHDRALLALLDLDAWLVARSERTEARLAELKQGVDDWRRISKR